PMTAAAARKRARAGADRGGIGHWIGRRPDLSAAALLGLCVVSLGAEAREAACAALTEWTEGPDDLTIAEAVYAADRVASPGFGPPQTLPPHCHVVGSFEHRTGVDGREYAIRFAINLPDDWNGRFLFQGGG